MGQKIGQPVLVVVGGPSPLADEGAVGAGGRDRPDDVGGPALGEPGAQGPVPTQGRTLTSRQVIGLFEDRLATYKHPRDVSAAVTPLPFGPVWCPC